MSDVPSKKRKTASEDGSSDETLSGRVNINVGGTKFAVDANTINQYPDTMLGSMLSKRWSESKSDKEIFLDRDPVLFRYILNFYRNGKMVISHTITKSEMLDEIEFFLLPVEKRDIQYDIESISGMRKAVVDFENEYINRLKVKERESARVACANGLAALMIEKMRKSPTRESIYFQERDIPHDSIVSGMFHSLCYDEAFKETIKGIVEKAGYTLGGLDENNRGFHQSLFEIRRSTEEA